MQRKTSLFERLESKPTMLFKRSDFEQVKCDVPTDSLPQFNLFESLCDINSSGSSFFATPPMENKFVVTPKAPVKNKKESKRADLKPKRLQYPEEELDADNVRNVKDTVPDKSSNALLRKRDSVQCNKVNSTQKRITRSHAKLDKIETQTIDKENDSTAINNSSRNTSIVRNNLTRVSSIVFNTLPEELSQRNSNLDWKGILHWIQARRDVGLWVECCRSKCKKWRYVEEYHDPLDVPKIWYCEMNSDKTIASCAIPEVLKSPALEADLIDNDYNAGSIVWAHVRGYPWWPAIVCDSPETFTYYKLYKHCQKPTKYFVTFFNDKLEYTWVHVRSLKPFARTEYSTLITTTMFGEVDYKSSLDKAYGMALSALPLSISERLQKFSYLAWYEKMYDVNNNETETIEEEMDTYSDEEIPSSNPTDSLSLRDYYFTVLCKTKDTQYFR